MKIIKIRLVKKGRQGKQELELREVKAYPCKIKGFEKIKLFVHKSHIHRKNWTVSEKTTGLCVYPFPNKTKKQAMLNTANALNERGLERVQASIQIGIEKYGEIRYL